MELPQLDDVRGCPGGRARQGQRRGVQVRPREQRVLEEGPRLVKINEVASKGDTPISLHFQEAFNAPNSPWLTMIRNAVLKDSGTVDADNGEITKVLGQ